MKLQFYKKGIPTRILKRAAILVAVFIASTIFFEIVTNVSDSVEVSSQDKPTLPVVSVNFLGDASCELHGYVTEMDPAYMRDAIIPLDGNRTISLSIDTKDFPVEGLSYEIRSLDTQRNISNNDLEFTSNDGVITAEFQAENLIEKNEEYLLILKLKGDGKDINYYTRIMQPEECHEAEILDFAQMIHEKTLTTDPSDKESELSTYIEPDPYNTDTNLNHVTINSSFGQFVYGTFDGTQVGATNVALTDITPNYTSLTFTYELTRDNEGRKEYYLCTEDFRVRLGVERMYLLGYDRTMEQLLDANSITVKANQVNIGIANPDVQYLSNETGTIVSFVQNGSLYEYNQSDRKIKQIFSFVDDPTDIRSIYDQHEIRLLNIDESGTMDFVVYGYMNSGPHEGQCGVNLYHYDAINDVSTEQVFISSTSSFQILNANFSELLYETADNEFYIMVNGTLLYMPLNELATKEIMTGLDDDQYAVSGSRRYLAWMDDKTFSESIHVMDLETNTSFDIKADSGQLLKPLGFMDDNLIYGTLFKHSITTDGAGATIYPMFKVSVSDITGGANHELKAYQKSGAFITDVRIDSFTIYLDRIQIDPDGTIFPLKEDFIKNSAGAQNKAVPISTDEDPVKQDVIVLSMDKFDENESLGVVSYDVSNLDLADASRNISVASATSSTQYFVYVGNKVTLATDNLIAAISEADENMGIVLNNEPKYVWKRGRKAFQGFNTNIAVGSSDSDASGSARALSAMLVSEGQNVQVHTLIESGETPISILSKTLKDNYEILDLTGASLPQILYYVSQGTPVYASTGDDSAVLIVGYDATTVTIFDPMTSSNSRMSIEEATEYFSTYGNVFVSYVK